MEWTGKVVNISRNWENNKILIAFDINENIDAELIQELTQCEKLTIKAVKYREKRSLDANAYCWTLIHKLSTKVGLSATEIYKTYIKDFGTVQIVPIREDVIERWSEIWQDKGIGWFVEDMGECRNTKGYHNIKCYYGSSVYDTAEMSALIDAIVQDCKEYGIETATPDEIARLKSTWGNQ